MNYYSIALFFHIVGALGLFVALGIEWTGLWQVRGAKTAEQIKAWIPIFGATRRLGMASMLTILIAGLYMMATTWGGSAWIIVAFWALVLMVAFVLVLTRPRMAALERRLSIEQGPVSGTLETLANNPILWISVQTRIAIALGIVFLMTVKPDVVGSLGTIVAAIALGAATALPMPRRGRVQERPAD